MARIDKQVEEHKETRSAIVRKTLRGAVEKPSTETGKAAYAEAREAVEENQKLPRYAALRDRFGMPDDAILISEDGYGTLFGVSDVMVTASRHVRGADHTAVNALALQVHRKARNLGWKGASTYEPKPGDDHMVTNSTAALFRHEYAHSIYEELTDEQKTEFEAMLPQAAGLVAWGSIAVDLSKYAAGDVNSRESYDKHRDDPVHEYLTETFAEAVSLTTGPAYNRDEWAEWVQKLGDWIDTLEPRR